MVIYRLRTLNMEQASKDILQILLYLEPHACRHLHNFYFHLRSVHFQQIKAHTLPSHVYPSLYLSQIAAHRHQRAVSQSINNLEYGRPDIKLITPSIHQPIPSDVSLWCPRQKSIGPVEKVSIVGQRGQNQLKVTNEWQRIPSICKGFTHLRQNHQLYQSSI